MTAVNFQATSGMIPRWMHVVRAVSSEGFGRLKDHTTVRRQLDTDAQFRRYFEQESTETAERGTLWVGLPSPPCTIFARFQQVSQACHRWRGPPAL
jgi:hypothetical protein